MIAVMLRAFAWRSPSWSLTSLWKLFARFASTAAGRACRPVGFGTMIGSEVTVGAFASRSPLRRRRCKCQREQRVLARLHRAARAFQRCDARRRW